MVHPTQVYQVFGKWYYVTCKICKYFSCTLCALMGLLTWWLQWLHNFKLSFCINWGLEFKEEQTTASFIPTLLQNLTLVIIIFPGLKQIVFLLEERVLTSQGVWILCQAQQQNPIVKLALLKFHALLHTNYGSWQFMTPPPLFPLWIMECPCDQPHLWWLWLGTYNPSVSISPIKCFVSQPLKF